MHETKHTNRSSEPAPYTATALAYTGSLTSRIEKLALEERDAVRHRDWSAARSAAQERVALQEARHRAAIPMAQAVLDRTDRPEVERLASAIVASQTAEIKAMQDMLRQMGEQPPPEKDDMDMPMG
ncbi:MAG: DUF305 domain-containing protein [Rubrobacteraceae bacterium]